MNGKKAKALRRVARGLTKGLPQTSYKKWHPPAFRLLDPINPLSPIQKIVKGVPAQLDKCTRRTYKDMKKLYIRGKALGNI